MFDLYCRDGERGGIIVANKKWESGSIGGVVYGENNLVFTLPINI